MSAIDPMEFLGTEVNIKPQLKDDETGATLDPNFIEEPQPMPGNFSGVKVKTELPEIAINEEKDNDNDDMNDTDMTSSFSVPPLSLPLNFDVNPMTSSFVIPPLPPLAVFAAFSEENLKDEDEGELEDDDETLTGIPPTNIDGEIDPKIDTKRRKPYKCEICRRCFILPVSLSAHMKRHEGVDGFECESCGKLFSTAQNLVEHARRHTGERRYKCDLCGKDFATSSNLSQHRVCHIQRELNPFKCETCGKLFPVVEQLTEHNNVMHAYAGERRYNCKTCGKCFATAGNLRQHKVSHMDTKSFSCEVCGTLFSSKRSLRRHVVRHTGRTGYNCETCGKPFPSSYDLNRHQSVHTGEKPFKCETCGVCYTTNYNLTAHMRCHTMNGEIIPEVVMDLETHTGEKSIHTGENAQGMDLNNHTGEKSEINQSSRKTETMDLRIQSGEKNDVDLNSLNSTEPEEELNLDLRVNTGEKRKTIATDFKNGSGWGETDDLKMYSWVNKGAVNLKDQNQTTDVEAAELNNHIDRKEKVLMDFRNQTGESEVLDLSVKRIK